jgi:hypothetical protein
VISLTTCGPAASAPTPTPEPQDRTYYDTLPLDTPTEAVETFVDAFQREDFMTVYLVLDYWAQKDVFRAGGRLDTELLVDVDAMQDQDLNLLGPAYNAHFEVGWHLFDRLMLAGSAQDALLIDLSGDVSIIETQDALPDARPDTNDLEVAVVDVRATVEGIDGEVVFRTTQSPVNDDWRVHQVIVPDGDTEQIPWSVPTE